MKNLFKLKLASSALALGLFAISCQNDKLTETVEQPQSIEPTSTEGDIINGQYIVLFKASKVAPASRTLEKTNFTSRETKANKVAELRKESIQKMNVVLDNYQLDQSKVLNYYTTKVSGITVQLSDQEMVELSKDPSVESIEYDREVELPKFEVEEIVEENKSQKMPQTTPCGISRAGGFINSSGSDRWIWIVDTGIDLDHPDLNVVTDSRYAKSFADSSPDDCNGHGTHVAGTAAAINNSEGVVGVSAGAPVVPVDVFGCSGSTTTSRIMAGIDHVGQFDLPGDAMNMSLGGFFGSGCSTSSPYVSSVTAVANGGTFVAIAAGNSAADTSQYSPGCVNGNRILTVASMTCNRSFSSFSNYNMNPVDVIATGSSVQSTYPGGRYATLSGTSMASPHVAGIMHARNNVPATSGSVSSRGENYPIAVRN